MEEKITVEDVQRLNVKPGDVLLVTVPRTTPPEAAQRIKNTFETQLPIRVLVKSADVQVEVVTEDGASA